MSYWKFEEGHGDTTQDFGQWGNNGEHVSDGSSSHPKWVPSPVANGRYGMYFSSADKDKMWNTSGTKLPATGTPRTITGWAKWPASTDGCCDGGPFLFGFGVPSTDGHTFAFASWPDGRIGLDFWNNGDAGQTTTDCLRFKISLTGHDMCTGTQPIADDHGHT
eukprot:COSAG05_NODE_1845_length_3976_cov_59.066804_1_plen_163_part_00